LKQKSNAKTKRSNMKTRKQIARSKVKFVVRQLAVLIAISSDGSLNAAAPSDFKTFTPEESYVVQGVSIVLTQKLAEAAVKVGSALQDSSTLTAANGAKFDQERSLGARSGIYELQSADPVSETASKQAIDSLNQDDNIEYAYPVYGNAATGKRHFLNNALVVRLKEPLGTSTTNLLSPFKMEVIDALSAGQNIYVFRLTEPKNFNPFKVCHALREQAEVLWAEPDMAQEIQLSAIPNDTSFASQWNLRNTGQTQAFTDADVDADEAWDGSQSYGSPGIRIAILDDGVQTTHPDLNDNIVPGFDFFGNDADPNPNHANDNHGTAVAGIVAAEVNNNSTGVAGMAGKCKILPVRIIENGFAVSVASIYRALVYAADNADVINCSWTSSPSSTIDDGFAYAWNKGRSGEGCVVVCSSGNLASGEGPQSYDTARSYDIYAALGGAAGNYFIGFQYEKNGAGSAGDDTVWLADITLPNGAHERLDNLTLPLGLAELRCLLLDLEHRSCALAWHHALRLASRNHWRQSGLRYRHTSSDDRLNTHVRYSPKVGIFGLLSTAEIVTTGPLEPRRRFGETRSHGRCAGAIC
jgi:subtilisin family serine protease